MKEWGSEKKMEEWGSEKKMEELYPPAHRKTYRQAMTGKSMKAAIKSQCLICQGFDKAGIRACTAPACSLFPYRPYRKKGLKPHKDDLFSPNDSRNNTDSPQDTGKPKQSPK